MKRATRSSGREDQSLFSKVAKRNNADSKGRLPLKGVVLLEKETPPKKKVQVKKEEVKPIVTPSCSTFEKGVQVDHGDFLALRMALDYVQQGIPTQVAALKED